MKLLAVLLLITLSSCAENGNMSRTLQPVKLLDSTNNTFYTTCSGAVEEWGSCFDKARKTCTKGYEVTDKEESSVNGKRELYFTCH